MMDKLLPAFLAICLLLAGCTYTVNLVHTQGQASDVVDDASMPSTSIVPTVTIPTAAL